MTVSFGAQPLHAAVRERVRSSKKLYDACYELVRHGDIANAIPVLTELTGHSAYVSDARQLLSVCKQLRRSRLLEETVNVSELLRDLHSVDRKEIEDVFIRRVEDSDETLVVFVTSGTVLWISLSLFHHHLRRYPVNLVYVQAEFGSFHMTGVNGLGSDYPSCVSGLRQVLDQLGTPFYFIGGSSSGYAALRFGIDLKAAAVMSFSGPTTIDPAQLDPSRRHFIDQLVSTAPEMAVDLVPLYQSADPRPRTILCYGTEHRWDPRHAKRLAQVDGVQLYPLDGYTDHDTLAYFLINGKFDHMFDLLRGWGT